MASKKYTARIVFPKATKSSYKSLLGTQREQKRSTIKITELNGTVIIEAEAADVTALRATLNALIRDIQVIEAASGVTTAKTKS
jgi:tRNA threonylcarbamoyladenosine modification (KEOPS) complex  Pcc1 subunit